MTTVSPLPRSLDPLPDESLPGYLLRLAHRLALAPARVMQLTGLTVSHHGHDQARQSLVMQLGEAAARSLASAARLTRTETSGLCLSSMSARYPWAAPAITSGQWGPRSPASPWVFTAATRYCPPVPGRRQQLHPAAARRRLAQDMAAAGRVRLPAPPPAA